MPTSGAVVFGATMDAPFETLALAPAAGWGSPRARSWRWWRLTPKPPAIRARLALPDPANQLLFSTDGRWLAASTEAGALRLWRLTEEVVRSLSRWRTPRKRAGPPRWRSDPMAGAWFPGDQDGGIRTWDLPGGRQRPRVRRGGGRSRPERLGRWPLPPADQPGPAGAGLGPSRRPWSVAHPGALDLGSARSRWREPLSHRRPGRRRRRARSDQRPAPSGPVRAAHAQGGPASRRSGLHE